MAEKKPSKYSDRGTVGSAEELDAYGVWVKSEPQDLTAGMAESVNFDTEAVPYADFDMEFDDSEESNFDFPGLEPEIPEISIESDEIASAESNDNDNFDDGIKAPYPGTPLGRGGEEASTQLLMKIADELSAIRSELSTLKKEFAGVRIESVPGAKAESRHGGFFDGEEGDDEKITLTGDEMQNILTSADFSSEEDTGVDPQREADKAALKEISEQNESAAEAEEEEEIKIDFDNLGISLGDDTEAEIHDEFPPLEADDELGISPLEELPSEELQEELMPLESLEEEDNEEMQELRREGAVPFTPAPDNSVYLETDPFALDESGLEDTSHEGIPLEESSLDENTIEETASQELSLDDVDFDLNADDFSIDESLPPLEEESGEKKTDVDAVDLSAKEKKSDEISVESPISLDEVTSDELSLESPISLDETTGDELSLESPAPLEEATGDELSLGSPISLDETTGDELSLGSPISLEEATSDELSLESPISLDETTDDELSIESPTPLEEATGDELSLESPPISLDETTSDEINLESPAPLEEATGDELSLESPISLDETTSDEISLESPAPLEEATGGEQSLDGESLDLSEAVIDEPDLSAGIVEAPLEEPVLGDISFGDDISLDMDDFGSGIDIDITDSGSAEDLPESPAVENLAIDDIDTNVELGAEDISLGDDLALGDVETSVELDTGDSGPAVGPGDDLALGDVETSVELDTGTGGDIELADDLSLGDDLALGDVETNVELDTGDSSPAVGPGDDLALSDVETSVELDTGTGDGESADGLSLGDDLALGDVETNVELDTGGDSGPAAGPGDDLALNDTETSVELDTGDSGLTDDLAGDLALDDFDAGIALDVKEDNNSTGSLADDDLTGVIPEAFEVNAKEAPVDDDLEAFDEGEISLPAASATKTAGVDAEDIDIPANFKTELKSVLSYMDRLLESLPEEKIEEFAKSEYFDSYKKIFKELGLV